MAPFPRYNILGTGVHALSLAQARDLLVGLRGRRGCGGVYPTTAHSVSAALEDPALRAAHRRALLVTPDGMPLVWLGRLRGHREVGRVYGPDLMLAVCAAGRAVGLRHYLYGGAPGVAESLRARLVAEFPGLEIVGTFTPPFRELTPEEFEAFRLDVAARRPDLIWIGLGSPKQEKFADAAASRLEAAALVTVGAAFDFLSGRVPQAPDWMRRSGLEWLHRLATEPRRLWRRYLLVNPLFALRTLAQLTGLRRYPLD